MAKNSFLLADKIKNTFVFRHSLENRKLFAEKINIIDFRIIITSLLFSASSICLIYDISIGFLEDEE